MAPLLSIVTVVKDDEAGLRHTRASLTASEPSTLHEIEWIVIDSSADFTSVRELTTGNSITTAVHWVPPQGVYEAMNAGLDNATGDYVYYLNAGDRLRDPESLAAILEVIKDSQPVWFYGQVAFISPHGQEVIPQPFDYLAERKSHFSHGRFPPHQGTIARRDALLSIGGFDTSYRITADYTTVLRLSLLDDPIEITDVIAEFTTGGLSESRWLLAINEFHRARLEVLRPRGWDLAAEFANTANQALRMTLTRALKGRSGRRLP